MKKKNRPGRKIINLWVNDYIPFIFRLVYKIPYGLKLCYNG